MGINVHDKIIKNAAADILGPIGVFQKGQSRTWIDDNGWFLTVVEFQPSTWLKGSYLNVGIHYLWNKSDPLTFDYGYREHESIEYTGDDEKFAEEMTALSCLAKEKVLYYRSFSELSFARQQILNNSTHSRELDLWNSMLICFLSSDYKRGRFFYNQVSDIIKNDYRDWVQELDNTASKKIAPILSNHESLEKYVVSSVRESRSFLRSKSSMKRLKEDIKYG